MASSNATLSSLLEKFGGSSSGSGSGASNGGSGGGSTGGTTNTRVVRIIYINDGGRGYSGGHGYSSGGHGYSSGGHGHAGVPANVNLYITAAQDHGQSHDHVHAYSGHGGHDEHVTKIVKGSHIFHTRMSRTGDIIIDFLLLLDSYPRSAPSTTVSRMV